jgi:U3 small nucleolar RNA-associated protein 12
LLESIQAHDGAVWSIDVRPDKGGLITGGADKDVKFWDFGAVEDADYSTVQFFQYQNLLKTTRRLTLLHMRTLKMTDEVLCVKHSSDGKLIAISLLDSTIKVFYTDSLKFFLSLYGHKVLHDRFIC